MSYIPLPSLAWQVITGELLGDAHISYLPNVPQVNGRLVFTFSSKILHYVRYLKYNVLKSICTKSEPSAWPNTRVTGKDTTEYLFSTKRLVSLNNLHPFLYKQVHGKYVKVLPKYIEQLLTPIGLAHWIMGDGYFSVDTIKICTDNFTKE
jgi:hypothetical protein